MQQPFPLYLNVYAGIRGVDQSLVEAGRTLGLSRAGLVWHVILRRAAKRWLRPALVAGAVRGHRLAGLIVLPISFTTRSRSWWAQCWRGAMQRRPRRFRPACERRRP
ncbi:ABC transporter permease subunit [Paracoccus mutanolyticus]|uniref:ABC transporter permease subunit n=1 Tax=Paracoccus mutanolyticus TaxID=1499308 RepID=UPI001CB9AC2D|nr:ABC transporter permease subunit [Paracoccus mutanolyticus]